MSLRLRRVSSVPIATDDPESVSIGMSSSSFGSSPSSAPGSTEGLTKVQRKNRKRYEAVKEAKAEAEADRLRRLAQYRKEQERFVAALHEC